NLSHPEDVQRILDLFLSDPDAIRMANWQSACHAFYAPKLDTDCRDKLRQLFDRLPHLKQNFPKSVFTAASLNFPPNTVCRLHTDHLNRAVGWCAITAGGNFDYHKGGHLFLPQLGLILEFPPGATFLLPSATLIHGNTPIQASESRFSFTQYMAGGLFRYVYQGFQTEPWFKATMHSRAAEAELERPTRWMSQISLFSLHNELHEDRMKAGIL
ncbi:hypothetical protein EIP86_007094, partial [Pleurotus ostreatoroseus]